MKDLYYKAKGWTEEGLIPKELLIKLGMPDGLRNRSLTRNLWQPVLQNMLISIAIQIFA